MPILRITVVEPPSEFTGYAKIALYLQTDGGYLPPKSHSESAIVFEVPFELKVDRSGAFQPIGPSIQRQNDGRRFVYLCWCGTQGTTTTMFRRLKVFFDTAAGFPGSSAEYEVHVKGKDKRGGPACATAEVLRS